MWISSIVSSFKSQVSPDDHKELPSPIIPRASFHEPIPFVISFCVLIHVILNVYSPDPFGAIANNHHPLLLFCFLTVNLHYLPW